jgi:uncharacterized surface protein with fasciclin (FAS1) repeats
MIYCYKKTILSITINYFNMKRFIKHNVTLMALFALLFTSCKKQTANEITPTANEEQLLSQQARAAVEAERLLVSNAANELDAGTDANTAGRFRQRNIVEIASRLPFFKSLVAAVVKTGLAGTLSSKEINVTVFAPTDAAFAKLPAPFNNPANIASITDGGQIAALKSILLYHVLGTEVKRYQIAQGRSSAFTLKPAGEANDNTVYFSNTFGLLFINGKSLVVLPDVNASNGVVHVINKVLIPPSQTIAAIAIGNPAFSSLVAALVKTDLAGMFAGAGDFTVFAPTDAAFAKLPAPFNNAANIAAITSQVQIDALANILKYHVAASRYFTWDLGILKPLTTIAAAPHNKLIGILGTSCGYVKGNKNTYFAKSGSANILATNGVVHVLDQVLLP